MSKKHAPSSGKAAPQVVTPMCGADVVVQCLVNHGVDTVFAYPGGYTIPLHQSLSRCDQIRVILPRHEQGGGFAAQGYARSTGKVGVCITTSGPGAANLLTAIADAKLDSIPLVAITGQVPTTVIGTDAFQEIPTTEVFRSITKHHILVTDPNDLVRVFKEAFYVANTGRKGPVLIDLPKDIIQATMTPDYNVPMQLPGYLKLENPEPQEEQIQAWADAIRQSKRPILYIGGGAAESASEVRKLVEKTGIPVTSTLMGLGVFPADHPLSLDMLGMHGGVYANRAVEECDLLISLGARFDDRVTGKVRKFAPHAQIVHVDIDWSEINKIIPSAISIHADVKVALKMLNKIVKEPKTSLQPWVDQVQTWKKEFPLRYKNEEKYILPQQAIEELCRMTKEAQPIVSVGVGQHQMWSAQFFQVNMPRHFLASCGLGTMGFGLPAGMGAKVANPDKMVIVIDGDGCAMMNLQEMATCYCEKIPVKMMILNNQHLGMVMQWEDRFFNRNRGNTYLGPIDNPENFGRGDGVMPENRYPDFVTLAKGFGWNARFVADPAELQDALREMVECEGPFLLDVATPYCEHVLPMIPAGGSFEDTIRE